MWQLFKQYYTEICRDRFELDLAQKTAVILLLDSGDKSIQGFSTIEVYKRVIDGKPVHAVYSGDTIISQDYWGQSALQIAFAQFLVKELVRNRFRPIHWFLISKGYKTYLLFSRNLKEYYPRHDKPTPAWERSVIHALASEKFKESWHPEEGVLRFPEPQGRLLEGVAPIDHSLIVQHSDIRFFSENNPGHIVGDELCCIGKFDLDAFKYFCSRLRKKVYNPMRVSYQKIIHRLSDSLGI
ncbi:MAG: hypothetical protein COA42_16175 [Alteromonadaceae bacterium]|nr:MAG: hypothetical protein COA42_16175 [Alteromonadaceae bacterium]